MSMGSRLTLSLWCICFGASLQSCAFFSGKPPLPKHASFEQLGHGANAEDFAAAVRDAEIVYFPQDRISSAARSEPQAALFSPANRHCRNTPLSSSSVTGRTLKTSRPRCGTRRLFIFRKTAFRPRRDPNPPRAFSKHLNRAGHNLGSDGACSTHHNNHSSMSWQRNLPTRAKGLSPSSTWSGAVVRASLAALCCAECKPPESAISHCAVLPGCWRNSAQAID